MQTRVAWLLSLFLFFFSCSTYWDVDAVKIHRAVWIRDEVIELFVGTECAFGSLSEYSQCSPRMCLCSQSLRRNVCLAVSLDMHLDLILASVSHTYLCSHTHTHTHNCAQPHINTHSPWAVRIQQFQAQVVAAVTVWHHQPGWQCPSGVLLWSQRYPSTELILWRCCVTQRPRQAVQQGWQPGNESSRAGRNYWQDPGEQLWVKPRGLLKGTYGLFKSIKTQLRPLLRDNSSC